MASTNGAYHNGQAPDCDAAEQQRLSQRQALLELIEEAQTIYSPAASGRLVRELLHRLPRWHTDPGLAAVWREQAPEMSEAEVEDLLSALLGDDVPNGVLNDLLLPQARYRVPGVMTLLAIARLRFPRLWAQIKAKARTAGWYSRDLDEFIDGTIAQDPELRQRCTTADGTGVWDKALSAVQFLHQSDETWTPFARDLVVQGGITIVAAPRSTGKSVALSMLLGVALATGGVFRGERVRKARVLLVDRDNPPALVRQRLRHVGAATVEDLHVLTRNDAPSLCDKAAWQAFPVDRYDVVIIDSLGAATEGISEREGKQTQEFLATLKDLAHRGPAILALDNTNKAGTSYRGRGEKADNVDILYEARDITGWTPSSGPAWWEKLPEAGDQAWQSRATRRRRQPVLRVAFVPSKYRLGVEPDPFALEVDFRQEPWTLRDITQDLETLGQEQARQQRIEQHQRLEDAARALWHELRLRPTGPPMLKTEAQQFLRTLHVTTREALNLLEDSFNAARHPAEGLWTLREIPDRPGNPIGVFPVDEKVAVTNIEGLAPPHDTKARAAPIFHTGSTPGVTNMPSIIPRNDAISEEADFSHESPSGCEKYAANTPRNDAGLSDHNICYSDGVTAPSDVPPAGPRPPLSPREGPPAQEEGPG